MSRRKHAHHATGEQSAALEVCRARLPAVPAMASVLFMTVAACTAGVGQGAAPAYQLRAPLDASRKTEVLVLGTEHLGALGDGFTPGLLSLLLDGLEGFGPDVIAVEQLPPAEINRLAQSTSDSAGTAAQLLAGLPAIP